MIGLNRMDLRELARCYVLANTPASLYRGLTEAISVRRMARECEPEELQAYYDRITARARRTEIEMGLAYAVLVAGLANERGPARLDATRLRWGPAIEDLISKTGIVTQHFLIDPSAPRPTIVTSQEAVDRAVLLIPRSAEWPGPGGDE